LTESSELKGSLPMKCLSVAGEKLNIVLMCVLPLMAPILTSTEHMRSYVKSDVLKCIDFSDTFYGWKYISYFTSNWGRTFCTCKFHSM